MKQVVNIPSYKMTDIKNRTAFAADFEFYRLESFLKDTDRLMHPHRHDHFALFFVTAGQGGHLIDFEEYELQAGRVFLIAPGQVHVWRQHKGVKGFALLFTKEFFTLTLQYKELRAYLFFNNIYKHAYLDIDKETGNHLQGLLKSIENEYLHTRAYSQNIIRSYINIILFELIGIYEKSIPSSVEHHTVDTKIRQFEGLIDKNFKKYHLVADYASILHITPNYLNAICTRRKGKPAGEVIRDRIILEAKRLLTHSDKTITQIAYDLGFEDNSYFGRFFRKYCDQTPVRFRDSQG